MKKHIIVVVIILMLAIVGLCGCTEENYEPIYVKDDFIGTWITTNMQSGDIKTLTFFSDSTCTFNYYYNQPEYEPTEGTFEINNYNDTPDCITITYEHETPFTGSGIYTTESFTLEFSFSNNGNALILTRTDLIYNDQSITYTKQ